MLHKPTWTAVPWFYTPP